MNHLNEYKKEAKLLLDQVNFKKCSQLSGNSKRPFYEAEPISQINFNKRINVLIAKVSMDSGKKLIG